VSISLQRLSTRPPRTYLRRYKLRWRGDGEFSIDLPAIIVRLTFLRTRINDMHDVSITGAASASISAEVKPASVCALYGDFGPVPRCSRYWR
jgi:hypothetical protein